MLKGWGRAHRFAHSVETPRYLQEVCLTGDLNVITTCYGQGRSYGDVALNNGGKIIKTSSLQRLISADWETGVIRAEAGMTLDQILRVSVPRGWFLSVTPGSKFVSLGGAVANDVHGKNHHHIGSFGTSVLSLGLRRSDGEQLLLSRSQNPELFALTISGLGLTGFIDWVEVQLMPVSSSGMLVENIPYQTLDAFFEMCEASGDWEYTVAWVDCFATGDALGRGVFTRAKHDSNNAGLIPHNPASSLVWPFDTPDYILNRTTISGFNFLYRSRPGARYCGKQQYDTFFYPLDKIADWNRMYGRNGFYQHQCIVSPESARPAMRSMLELISQSGQGSFLAVMKNHGPEHSPGRNSFCMEGTSLALDFANRGKPTVQLLESLDEIVVRYGGRLYPAKDGLMSAETFQRGYPNWEELEEHRDPVLSSAFWQRVTTRAN